MRKMGWMCVLLMLVMLSATVQTEAAVQGSAQAAIVMEQSTGRVLHEIHADQQLAMASTTKIMTALCVLENVALEEHVVIDERMTGIEGSSIYLEVGEELTVEQLLYGLMLRSGNDAAVALAIHTAGSVEDFAALMNAKAAQLGLKNTHFVSPHGLPAEEHYTTARELAILTAVAYENADFRRIVSTQYVTVPWKGHPYDRAMKNKNKILTMYEGGNGVKTGYTKAAGRCLVSGAERDGMQLVCVVLNAPNMWNDSMSLMDYGFENYHMAEVLSGLEPVAELECAFSDETVPILPAWDAEIPLSEGEEPTITLELPEKIETGVARGGQMGYAIIGVEGTELMRVPLLAGCDAKPPTRMRYADAVLRVLRAWVNTQKE